MGVVHDDWQQALATAILAKRANGLYAAGVGGVTLSTCRQVGKTFTIGTIIFALCALSRGTKVLWTSHHGKTTDETFESLVALAQKPQIAPYIRKTPSGSGKQQIVFTNGSRILFGAREHGFGRGIPGVTVVVFDEAQILKAGALNDMVPALNTIKNPLVLLMGTPPDPKDPAEVFKARRRKALDIEQRRAKGEKVASNALYVEIGADDDPDPDDRRQWGKGNPSYPDRTPEASIERMRELLPDVAAFIREGLGVWDREVNGTRLITEPEWAATAVGIVPQEGVKAIGVAFNLDGTRVSVSGALKHADGIHTELIDARPLTESGIGPLADWLAERKDSVALFVISGRAGADALYLALRERKVSKRQIHLATTVEYTASCSMLHDAVRGRTVTHPKAPAGDMLDASIAVADKKQRGQNGAWGWVATTPDGDETPAEGISLALWGVRTTKRRPGRKRSVMTA
ncbi:terminase [Microbacterium halotolerans]|uniref:terminase n=1 Tax=Microbacterium halotolerans TaxID=246613 RepID=UPI0013C30C9E|nr:terminase [Microbacterium halotolerans]